MKSSIWIPVGCFLAGTVIASFGFFLFSSAPSPERPAPMQTSETSVPSVVRPAFSDSSLSVSVENTAASATTVVSTPSASAVRRSSAFTGPAAAGIAPSGGYAYSTSDLSARPSARPGSAALPAASYPSVTATFSSSGPSATQAASAGSGAVLAQAPASAAGFAQQVYASGNMSSGGVTLPLSLTPNLESAPAVTDQQLATVDDAANQFLEQVQNDPAPTSSEGAQATWDRAAAANDDLLRAKLGWAGFNALSRQSAMPATDSAVQ